MRDILESRPSRGTRWCKTGTVIIVVGLLLMLVSGPGYRADLLGVGGALLSYAGGSALIILGLLLSLIGLIRSRGSAGRASAALTWAAFLAAVALTVNNGYWFGMARSAPPIHDITTDTQDPPQFQAILPLRADAPNSPQYAGGEVAAAQEKAYPDIKTLALQRPADQVFTAAMAVANKMNWNIAAADESQGRIEATATTRWFGFKDDIVVRIRARGGETLVDLRSESRVGRGDVGTNASRIRKFRALMEKALLG